MSFERAKQLYAVSDYGAAAALLATYVATAPQPAAAIRLLGMCRLRQGDPAAAVVLLERACRLAPGDPWGGVHLALALLAAGRPADAAPLLRAASLALPDDATPSVNLVAALLAVGDGEAALAAGQEARRRAPHDAPPAYALGQAWMATGRWAEAEATLASAVQMAPDFADAWVNLGLARYRLGKIGLAKAAMQQALACAPRHRAALANLTAFQRLTGEADQAETLLRSALAKDPDAIGLRLNFAALLLQDNRSVEALDVLGPQPSHPQDVPYWSLQCVAALLQVGRREEAGALLQALPPLTPELEPLRAWRQVLLAQANGDDSAARTAALRTEEALAAADGRMLPEHAIMARFDLGRFWSSLQERERAVASWRAGHGLLSHFQPFSRERHRAFVDGCIAHLDRAALAALPTADDGNAAPVFIVGMPRSGTTLAEQILAAHSQGYGAGERAALGRTFNALCGPADGAAAARVASLDKAALDAASASYLAELQSLSPQAGRIVDKMPGNFMYLGLVARLLPGARIIHCNRDPRDIGLSIFTYRFHGQHGYAHDLGDLGWYIGEHHRLMAHWRAALPHPPLTLNLADWVTDFDATLRRVLAFLDLPFEAGCARFHEATSRVRTVSRWQVREPVNARGLGRWQAYAEQLGPLIRELEAAGLIPS